MRPRVPASPEVVHSVTTAPRARTLDIEERQRRYLLTMGFRTVCFLLVVVLDGWLRWTVAGFAVFLPLIAVILANAVGPRVAGSVTPVLPQTPLIAPRAALQPGDPRP
ncbi:MAG: DUF3099 domain-containing protein [Tetrasphaera sp.]|nr:DUF3099 domain-containing protein [Tetrasphaera sp.]